MSWNNGYERKRFEKKLERQKKEYKELGMTDAQIAVMEAEDWDMFRSNRRYYSHTQPLEYYDGFDDESRNPLLLHFKRNISVLISPDYSNKEWWIEEIENEKIYNIIKKLTGEERTILSMLVFEGLPQNEVCRRCGISRFAVYRRMESIRRKFSQILNGEDGDQNEKF